MNTDTLVPPSDVLDDIKTLKTAGPGTAQEGRMHRLVGYFDDAEMKSQQLRLQSDDYEQKQFAGQLADALAAARRIVLVAAEKADADVPAH